MQLMFMTLICMYRLRKEKSCTRRINIMPQPPKRMSFIFNFVGMESKIYIKKKLSEQSITDGSHLAMHAL